MTIRFTILGEPASKANSRQLVTFGRGAKARPALIKSEKAREYETAAIAQIPADARVMLEGPVFVKIKIYYASERPDLDESVVLDVLQAKFSPAKEGPRQLLRAGVYRNDRQVRKKLIEWGLDRDNPRAEIEVEQLQPEASLFDQLPIPVAARPRKKQRAEPPRQSIAELAPGEVPF
jgi:hypothetical protein